MQLDPLTQLPVADVGIAQADVIGPSLHRCVIWQCVDEATRRIAHMKIVPLEMGLEQDGARSVTARIGEIIHEQIESHPGADAEQRGKPECDIFPLSNSIDSSSTFNRP